MKFTNCIYILTFPFYHSWFRIKVGKVSPSRNHDKINVYKLFIAMFNFKHFIDIQSDYGLELHLHLEVHGFHIDDGFP